MFSFHKPKVYRSPTGCCICKAKSSSSRFTDSGKYEEDFIECFLLTERRTGEICNACVLLVKRWKKLPPGSDRNWRHVVDARAGPGIKSLTKFRAKNKKNMKENAEKMEKIVKKKHVYVKPDRCREQSPAMSDDLTTEEYLAGTGSKGSSRAGSPAGSDDTAVTDKRLDDEPSVNDWIDLTYFKRETICCGTIFKGPYGEVIVDPSLIKPCVGCLARQRAQRERRSNVPGGSPAHSSASASPVHSSASASPSHSVDSTSSSVEASTSTSTKPIVKTFCDSSSDSGYDESSNPGIGDSKIAKINETTSNGKNIINSINSIKSNNCIGVKPINSLANVVQLKSIAVTETVRIKTEIPIKLLPLKQMEKTMCKPLALAVTPNVNITLSSSSTSRPIVATITSNPLVDFAIHASTRQSVAN